MIFCEKPRKPLALSREKREREGDRVAESSFASRLTRMLGAPRPEVGPRREREPHGLPEGTFVAPGVLEILFSHPLGSPHGAVPLEHPDAGGEALAPWGGARNQTFLDLETTGLAGGTGTYAFLAGVGRVEGTCFVVRQLFLLSPAAEEAWFRALEERVGEGCFVTYNGRAFDLPLLRTRAVMTGRPPLRECRHLDLLPLARRLWREDLPGCALGEVERGVVGFRRPGEDVPGALIPELYATFLRTGDAAPLRGVFLHNRWDILSLAAAQECAARVVSGSGGSPGERVRAGALWAQQGRGDRAELFWRSVWRSEAPEEDGAGRSRRWMREAAFLLGMSAKRQARWEEAASCFQEAARGGGRLFEALTELAKVAEHHLRDEDRALEATERGLALLRELRPHMDRLEAAHRQQDLLHRRDRLVRKKGKRASVLE